jgi:hypothetical protein
LENGQPREPDIVEGGRERFRSFGDFVQPSVDETAEAIS